MTFRVRIGQLAQSEIIGFGAYCSSYEQTFAIEQIDRLTKIIAVDLAEAPLRWAYFWATGAPYRAYLFRVGRHTQYWIIYTVDEEANMVTILRFWNVHRDPDALTI